MHHPRPEDLDPPRSLARRATGPTANPALYVHLGRGFGEREERWTEARARRAEEPARELVQRRLEVYEADALVHAQAFDLHEGRRVRRIEEIAAIRIAGNQHANGRLEFLQRADLHWRRVRAQQPAV